MGWHCCSAFLVHGLPGRATGNPIPRRATGHGYPRPGSDGDGATGHRDGAAHGDIPAAYRNPYAGARHRHPGAARAGDLRLRAGDGPTDPAGWGLAMRTIRKWAMPGMMPSIIPSTSM